MIHLNKYLYQIPLHLKTENIKKDCLDINKYLQSFPDVTEQKLNHYGSKSTTLYNEYNIFTYTSPHIRTLYEKIKGVFNEIKNDNEYYMIQGWINIFEKGQNIDWHGHWESEYKAWHGFYCVDVEKEPSHTEYKLPFIKDIVKVDSKDNLLVIGKSDNDKHRSSVWNQETPRITLAFDILPMSAIEKLNKRLNHWIPL